MNTASLSTGRQLLQKLREPSCGWSMQVFMLIRINSVKVLYLLCKKKLKFNTFWPIKKNIQLTVLLYNDVLKREMTFNHAPSAYGHIIQ